MTSKIRTRKRKRASLNAAAKKGERIPSTGEKLLKTTPVELEKKLGEERQALKAIQDFDAGARQDADEVADLVAQALERSVDVTDFVEREQAQALLARNIRMKETALRILEIQRTKTFNQQATRLLFDKSEKSTIGSWTSLFVKS